MVACSFENYGCSGGFLVTSIDFLESEGVTSEECMPYQDGDSKCNFKCINSTSTYTKYYCKPGSLNIATNPSEIQREIMNNGPVMVGLSVYEDFLSYESGIYHFTSGTIVGGHAMKMIGWGTDPEDGTLYWIL
jgi:cathepsin B